MKHINIEFDCVKIAIDIMDDGHGVLVYSNLWKHIRPLRAEAIDRLILAHACAGVDVQSGLYIKGLQVVIEDIVNDL